MRTRRRRLIARLKQEEPKETAAEEMASSVSDPIPVIGTAIELIDSPAAAITLEIGNADDSPADGHVIELQITEKPTDETQ